MKKLLAAVTAFFNVFAFMLGADCEIRRNNVDDGICDYSGQRSDKYGR